MGLELRFRLLEGQPQPAFLDGWVRMPDPTQVQDDPRGVHSPRRRLEPPDRGHEGEDGAVLPQGRG